MSGCMKRNKFLSSPSIKGMRISRVHLHPYSFLLIAYQSLSFGSVELASHFRVIEVKQEYAQLKNLVLSTLIFGYELSSLLNTLL